AAGPDLAAHAPHCLQVGGGVRGLLHERAATGAVEDRPRVAGDVDVGRVGPHGGEVVGDAACDGAPVAHTAAAGDAPAGVAGKAAHAGRTGARGVQHLGADVTAGAAVERIGLPVGAGGGAA